MCLARIAVTDSRERVHEHAFSHAVHAMWSNNKNHLRTYVGLPWKTLNGPVQVCTLFHLQREVQYKRCSLGRTIARDRKNYVCWGPFVSLSLEGASLRSGRQRCRHCWFSWKRRRLSGQSWRVSARRVLRTQMRRMGLTPPHNCRRRCLWKFRTCKR